MTNGPLDTQVWVVGEDSIARMLDCPKPRALSITDIAAIIEDYRHAARNTMLAGFDDSTLFGGNAHGYSDYPKLQANHEIPA